MRERDWCNVITAHEGDTAAYTWLLKNFTLGEALVAEVTCARASLSEAVSDA